MADHLKLNKGVLLRAALTEINMTANIIRICTHVDCQCYYEATTTRCPECTVLNERVVFKFLDELRQSGETNMFNARPYIIREFDCTEKVSNQLLRDWMKHETRIRNTKRTTSGIR